MRETLRAMAEAGIRRARFQGRFCGVSFRGYSILYNVWAPVGCIDHLWVEERLQLEPGCTVDFLATIKCYKRCDGSRDLTLGELEVLA